MFTSAEDLHILKNYLQRVIERPRPIDAQPHQREGAHLFCQDWEIIEVLKYYINGPEMYRNDPPPNRLKNNPLWSKEKIIEKAEGLIDTFQGCVQIVEFFKHEREKVYG